MPACIIPLYFLAAILVCAGICALCIPDLQPVRKNYRLRTRGRRCHLQLRQPGRILRRWITVATGTPAHLGRVMDLLNSETPRPSHP